VSGERETLRLAAPVIFWWVWLAFTAANVIDYAVQGLPSARFGAVLAAVLLFVTGAAYTLALRPRVVIGGDGVTVVNPYRTHVVPWRLITAVDTGEWVRIHYTPAADAGSQASTAASGFGRSPVLSSAGGKTVHCWALYVSTRARRKIAAGPPRPRDPLARAPRGLGRGWSAAWAAGSQGASGAARSSSARLPDEARYLASLPPAKAMAVRLDARAGKERAAGAGDAATEATAAWAWPALTAVVIPAVVLLAVMIA
jgi:hypothetical protein